MRIALLCNDRVAIPSLDSLAGAGLLAAVGMSDRDGETKAVIRSRCQKALIPFTEFSRNNLEADLKAWLNEVQPDVVLVKTFPFLIPGSVLAIPKFGFINFHYAPLPAWRGSNPLFWMIRNREVTGGVTVHQMSAAFDAGPVLLEQSLTIGSTVNFGILYTQLAYLGVQLTAQLINALQAGAITAREQDESRAGWYRNPSPAELFIDWKEMDAEDITALVKACNPWNKGAGTSYKGWVFGITYASVGEMPQAVQMLPGTILSVDSERGLVIAARDAKTVVAEVVYCEEGFYPGYCMSAFGLKVNEQLS